MDRSSLGAAAKPLTPELAREVVALAKGALGAVRATPEGSSKPRARGASSDEAASAPPVLR
jgi:hypothetical protein